MDAAERRARIVDAVDRDGSARIADLVELLGVSRLTVRADVAALHRQGRVRQIRGAAVALPASDLRGGAHAVSGAAQRALVREAAALLGDGDSLALDASMLSLELARALRGRRGLRAVVASLEAAICMAAEPSNTVLLAGSLLRPGGQEVRLHPREEPLHGWQVHWAFLAATHFTPQGQVCDPDPASAELRRALVRASQEPVLLLDEERAGLGTGGVEPVAHLAEFRRVLAAQAPSPKIRALLSPHATLTVCEAGLGRRTAGPGAGTYRIAFANMSDQAAYCLEVRRGVERAASAVPNMELLLLDNGGSDRRVLENLDVLIAAGPDLVIEYGVDEAVGNVVMDRLRACGIPVIAVDLPLPGATYFGVDNYRAGQVAGQALAAAVVERWQGRADLALALEAPRMRPPQRARLQGQLDALHAALPGLPVRTLQAGHDERTTQRAVAAALPPGSPGLRLLPLGINDEAVLGALAACAGAAGQPQCLAVSLGLDWRAQQEALRPGSPLVGGVAFHPGRYGEVLLRLALDMLGGRPVPPATFVAHRYRSGKDLAVSPSDLPLPPHSPAAP